MKRQINKLDDIVSTNINTNQVYDVVDNELKFDIIISLANNHVQNNLPMVTIRLIVGELSQTQMGQFT